MMASVSFVFMGFPVSCYPNILPYLTAPVSFTVLRQTQGETVHQQQRGGAANELAVSYIRQPT